MCFGVHGPMRLDDVSIGADDVGDALRRFVGDAVAGAVGDTDRPVGVAQQGVGEFVLRSEFRIRFDVVGADAEDLDVLQFVVVDSNTESIAFSRSPAGAGFRVEPHDNGFSGVVAELDGGSGVILDFESRSLVADVEHLYLPPIET
jgi:hypothetical protein